MTLIECRGGPDASFSTPKAGITCGFSVNLVNIPGWWVPSLYRGHEPGAAMGDQGLEPQNPFLVLLKLLK